MFNLGLLAICIMGLPAACAFDNDDFVSRRIDESYFAALSFELSWPQRHGALGSKRKMGRRLSA